MEWRNVGLRGNTNTLGYVSTKIEKRKPMGAYCTKSPYKIPCRLCNFHIGNRTSVCNSVFAQKKELKNRHCANLPKIVVTVMVTTPKILDLF